MSPSNKLRLEFSLLLLLLPFLVFLLLLLLLLRLLIILLLLFSKLCFFGVLLGLLLLSLSFFDSSGSHLLRLSTLLLLGLLAFMFLRVSFASCALCVLSLAFDLRVTAFGFDTGIFRPLFSYSDVLTSGFVEISLAFVDTHPRPHSASSLH